MNNTFELELRAHIEALVYKKYTGEISIEEEEELSILLETHPELKDIQQELEKLIAEGVLETKPKIVPISAKRELFENKIRRTVRISKIRKWTVAASIFILLGAGSLYFFSNFTGDESATVAKNIAEASVVLTTADGQVITLGQKREIATAQGTINASLDSMLVLQGHGTLPAQLNELKVPEKRDYSITLADGTKVRLNSATILRFPFNFNGGKREVYIDGEAYFSVASNAQQPFIVNTPAGAIKVLGTEFNVNTYDNNQLITSLVSGATLVQTENDTLQLAPGQEAIVLKGNPIKKVSFDRATTLSWMNGILYFDQTTLVEIASRIERWYGFKVMFDDPTIKNVLLTTHLNKHKHIESFLTMLQNTTSVKSYFKNGNLHLY